MIKGHLRSTELHILSTLVGLDQVLGKRGGAWLALGPCWPWLALSHMGDTACKSFRRNIGSSNLSEHQSEGPVAFTQPAGSLSRLCLNQLESFHDPQQGPCDDSLDLLITTHGGWGYHGLSTIPPARQRQLSDGTAFWAFNFCRGQVTVCSA